MPDRTATLLWRIGNAACICQTVEVDHIEITLTVKGVVVQSGWFDHHAEASRFAIELRRALASS